jgi:hypothetical protein
MLVATGTFGPLVAFPCIWAGKESTPASDREAEIDERCLPMSSALPHNRIRVAFSETTTASYKKSAGKT